MKLMLADEARKLQRDYIRDWRRRNPDKVRKYNQDYWNRKVQQRKETDHAEANKE